MAKGIRCSVRLNSFKWSRCGYAEVMDSAPVQALVAEPAQEVLSASNASFAPDTGEGDGYAMRPMQGKLAKGYVVGTATVHAYNSELRHNRLLRALGSVGT